MKRLVLLAALAATGLSACNRTHTDTEATAVTPAPDPAAAPPQTASASADGANQPVLAGRTTAAGFVARATLSDLYEVESSRLALERTQSATVRAYAQAMVEAHTATSARLAALLRANAPQIAAPASLDREGSDRIADLRSVAADGFDALYVRQQTEAHRTALALMRDYASGGDNRALQTYARETAPIVEAHLTQVEGLLQTATPTAPPTPAAPPAAVPAAPSAQAPAAPAPRPAGPARPPAG